MFMEDRLIKGVFQKRINRFVVECVMDGQKEIAYLPNPGRLYELLLPGMELYLKRNSSHSSFKYRVFGINKDGIKVLVDTHHTNHVARELIVRGYIDSFRGYKILQEEVKYDDSRFDFLLGNGSKKILLEVKSCTLFGDKTAMFPDAISERAKRHILTLSKINDRGTNGAILFVINSALVKYFLPEYHTDPEFSDTLYFLKDKIIIKAVKINWSYDFSGWKYGGEAEIPWGVFERERGGRGAYILGLFLPSSRDISIGGLGKIHFRNGYYLYAGSAMKNLDRRMRRHRKIFRKVFWHIDYLRNFSDFKFCMPVRTEDRIECEIGAMLKECADGIIEGFGCSDCNCRSHLFWMRDDPLSQRSFINIIQYFRIDRLDRKYNL